MAQELEQILDLLREIRRTNSVNDESFNRLLTSISSKVDTFEKNSLSADLIKSYLGDLTRSLDSKYQVTSEKFADIEKALKTIFNGQENQVKTKDMRELFDIFTKNLNDFYLEVRQQKSAITSIESTISSINSNKTDKEEILKTISLLRSDFDAMNMAYKSSIESLSTDLKSILSNLLNIDQTAVNEKIQKQVEEMYKAVGDVITFLKSIDQHEVNLESILMNTASAESLKVTQLAIDSIIDKTGEISKRLDELHDTNASKEEFSKLSDKFENLNENADEIKHALVKITKNIDALIDINTLEESIQNVYNNSKEIHEDLLATHVKGDVRELGAQIDVISSELYTAKNIVVDINDAITSKLLKAINDITFEKESYEIKNDVSKMLEMLPQKDDVEKLLENDEFNKNAIQSLMNKVDDVADLIDNLPKQGDIRDLNNNQISLVENLQGVANKEDVEHILQKNDDIETMIDKLNFDKEFENIYGKTSSVEEWLIKSKLKENTSEILEKIDNKAEQKDVMTILRTTEEIVNNIDELSKNADVKKVNRTVAEVYQLIEDLKNDFINTSEMHNDSVIVHLSELQKSIEYIVTGEEFENFVQDLKNFVDSIGEKLNNSNNNAGDILNYQKEILAKIAEIDVEAIENAVDKKVSEKLISINEYIEKVKHTNPDDIRTELLELKEILSNKRSNIAEIEEIKESTITTLENYLQEIKVLLDTNTSKKDDEEISQNILMIEDIIKSYHAESEANLTNIILKLDDVKYLIDEINTSRKRDLREAIGEVNNLADSLGEIAKSFEGAGGTEGDIAVSSFVADNISQISSSLSQLSQDVDSNIQTGFSYNSQLIEEKTALLLDYIKEVTQEKDDSTDLANKLNNANEKISDILQNLQWMNSDVVNHVSNQSEMLLKELIPIKEMLSTLYDSANLKNDINLQNVIVNLHEAIAQDLEEVTKYSKSTYEKLESSYKEITDSLNSTKNDLKDFFLQDIDSIIRKIDTIKDDLETSSKNLTIPEASQILEIKDFKDEIEQFKNTQKGIIDEASKDVKETILTQMNSQHEELKSLISVAMNNAEIIKAIDELKETFKSKIVDFEKNEDAIFDNIDSEQDLDSVNENLIKDLKNDYQKFTDLIKDLSGDNSEIKEVLSAINEKMDNISVLNKNLGSNIDNILNSKIEGIKSEDNKEEKTLVGVNNFDFIKAFDLLKEDIEKLNENILKIIPQDEKISEGPVDFGNILLSSLSNKIDALAQAVQPQNWLNEIKEYTFNDGISELLEQINGKLDALMKSDNSDVVNDVKNALNQVNNGEGVDKETSAEIKALLTAINDKIDALTGSADSTLADDIMSAIKNLHPSKMLDTINSKIDVIASADNTNDFDDIKDALDSIEDKIESNQTFDGVEELNKKLQTLESKLDTIAAGENSADISNSLFTIEDTLSEIESHISSGVSQVEYENINSTLKTIENKIDVLAATDNTSEIDDIRYTLLNVDEKMDAVKQLSDSDSTITAMLEDLSEKIEELSVPSDDELLQKNELKDIKTLIMAQTDYIESLEKNSKTEAVRKCLKELTVEINNLNTSGNEKSIQKSIKEMKESLMSAVITVFDQVSFVEESEEIKDFVEEKTDEINKNLAIVTGQLKQLANSGEDDSYSYSMQDIESDLAKMRIALNELKDKDTKIQATNISSILENVSKIGESVDNLQNSLTQEEVFGLKNQFDSLNMDIRSLNDLTNQLVDKSKHSYDELNSGLVDFEKALTKRLTSKLENILKLLEKSQTSDKVMRQALIYMGEWIDSTSNNLDDISKNSKLTIDINTTLDDFKKIIPKQTEILEVLSEKLNQQEERLALFEKSVNKISILDKSLTQQQERLDRIEMTLEKILSVMEDVDDSKVSKKIDKVDKQLGKLGINIEKLVSYVD